MADSLENFVESHTREVAEKNYELGRASLEAENALLKKKLKIAMRGLDRFKGRDFYGYELARRIKAEIEEVK